MTDIPTPALSELKFSIESHGTPGNYAIYLGRDSSHHGLNLAYVSEVDPRYQAALFAHINRTPSPALREAAKAERVEELRELAKACPHTTVSISKDGFIAICDRLLALEAARWVPWKPGDALPASAPVLHWTTWFDKAYTDVPMMRASHAHDFERWSVIAYWSVTLPAPYEA